MKLKTVVEKLNAFLEKYPDRANEEVFLWDEDGQTYVGFDKMLKARKKAYIEKDCIRNGYGEDEVFFTIADFKDMVGGKKEELIQIVLL